MTIGELLDILNQFEPYQEVLVDGYSIKSVGEIDDPESPRDGCVDIESESKGGE